MKYVSIIYLIALASCAHYRAPSSVNGQQVASDSIALGNVTATATKSSQKSDVCFDINVVVKGTDQAVAQPSNWTLAWVDKAEQYHLMNFSQREPASVPQGGRVAAQYGEYEQWSNTFRTCAPEARFNEVKALVLTPKSLPYKESKGLYLNWQ